MNQLEQHVIQLTEHHDVECIFRGRGIAYPRERRITIPHVRGQVSYLVALHELGHVVGRKPRLRLSQEVEAWKWALANSIADPTEASYRSITRCLDNYLRRAQRWRSMQIPQEFIEFHEQMRLLGGEHDD